MVWVGAIVANPFTTHISDRTCTYSLHRSTSHWALRPTRPRASRAPRHLTANMSPAEGATENGPRGRLLQGTLLHTGEMSLLITFFFNIPREFSVIKSMIICLVKLFVYVLIFCGYEWGEDFSNMCMWICLPILRCYFCLYSSTEFWIIT